ncbi:pyruvate, phosphate dikinase [Capillimicrobium parvum]|uniref:Pyruvate, phosphate dikinase n=1 Tax=Capillimicrobium parvum TaxID=2884022 RepID=A0A9E6XYU9_9ACTN|nr:pyruvate, phosphate dikinase [Capillimicrobium parvum]UGS36949.1 Pyruvate, phosphate dikinase [Capillimicrobium parvum]
MSGVSEHVIVLDGDTLADREQIGNKGASVARMLGLGLPVPPAFALPIEECRRYHAAGGRLDDKVWAAVLEGVAELESRTGRRLGDPQAPLLVSVRSGAAVSMPGMMDTILNLGMTEAVREGLAALSGDAGFARSTHVRFCHEFGHTVLGADIDDPGDDATPDVVCAEIEEDTGEQVPGDPYDQLRAAIHAVFESWSSRRAIAYRKHWGIPQDGGTAVVVQAMVFGNLGERSGTGVLFTRDPLSGAPEPYGEWLPGGQGEDVVSGSHDPLPLEALREQMPEVHDELLAAAALLERTNGDVQDIEFTVEGGRLYLLQTRSAKRAPLAAVRTAVDLATEGAIEPAQAIARVSAEQLASVLAPRLARETADVAEVLVRGVAACPGVASGRVVADADAAEAAADAGEDVVLARPTTSPEDVSGMIAARAVVTERGGSTSHAAVVTRALGRPSVVGVGEGATGAWADREVTVDGSAGVVYAGRLATEEVGEDDVPGLAELVAWARELSPTAVVDEAEEVVDLDEAGLVLDPEDAPDAGAIAQRLAGAPAARGSVLATAEGARAVARSGVPAVVRLPGQHEAILLLRLAQEASRSEEER